MRIDIITIFPEYLAPLELSVIGKAQRNGLLTVEVHDLRAWATDTHHTVDDSPYGGGPGMVMRADIWGLALDSVRDVAPDKPLLIIPTPSGHRITSPMVEEWADLPRLVIACGRYEGIDSRVAAHYRTDPNWLGVREVSVGDIVVAGGEAAALMITEAVGRLIPGVLGNNESAIHDSFAAGHERGLEG
ncbi:MAG: hypothetical protein RJB01_832, partial [Actinomycetota bacterium]